jgi:trigger factor
MPGFRPGKAPINAIKKAVHPQEYIQAAANKQINDTIRDFSETTPETNFIGASPKVEVKQANEHTLVFSATFEKMPTVKIADYKTFDIKLMDEKVTNEEVQHEFDRMVKKDVMLTNKDDGTVENGDSVNIDFTGYLNDKKFPGGSSKNYDLVIGSNSFIPGFEEQIIGMKNGEEKDILVTFPKDYHSTDLAGKETKFVVKVNSIHSVSYPTFNKEYFSKFKLPGITNESEFKEYLKKQLVD